MFRLRVVSAWVSAVRAPFVLTGLAITLGGCAGSPVGETAALNATSPPMSSITAYVGRPFLVASQRLRSDEADAIVARAIAEHEMRRP
jgi:hypothetical protein